MNSANDIINESINDSIDIILWIIIGAFIYWIITRAYITWKIEPPQSAQFNANVPWSKQFIKVFSRLHIGIIIRQITVDTISLLFFGVMNGILIATIFAFLEFILQFILRIGYIIILSMLLLLILTDMVILRNNRFEKTGNNLLTQIKYEVKRFFRMMWEFCTIPIISFRELLWWIAPFIRYRRFPKFIRLDRFPSEMEKKEMDIVLHSAWFSLDLWRSLTFFCDRPYPEEFRLKKK
jgi:hypothetical protein